MADRSGLASVNLGSTKAIAQRLVAEGHYENVSEAVRAGLRNLDREAKAMNAFLKMMDDAMASGIAEDFDVDAIIAASHPDE